MYKLEDKKISKGKEDMILRRSMGRVRGKKEEEENECNCILN